MKSIVTGFVPVKASVKDPVTVTVPPPVHGRVVLTLEVVRGLAVGCPSSVVISVRSVRTDELRARMSLVCEEFTVLTAD